MFRTVSKHVTNATSSRGVVVPQWRRQDFCTGEAQGGHQFLEEGHIFLHINLIISVLMYRAYNKELSKIRVQIGNV